MFRQQLRCLGCRFDCYRVERTSSRGGVAPAEVQRLFTVHFFANYLSDLPLIEDRAGVTCPSTILCRMSE